MPAKPKHDTLSRLLELLKALPTHRWATAGELRRSLADRGFDVDLRSVQRDLKELQQSFALDHNDKGKPHGFLKRSPDTATVEDLRRFQLYLVDQGTSPITTSATIVGLKFFFDITLGRSELMSKMQTVRVPQKMHVVLSRARADAPPARARHRAGGGLGPNGNTWVACRPGFFLPVRVLSQLFRRRFLEGLVQWHRAGRLQFFSEHAALHDAKVFTDWLAPMRRQEWVVYVKRPLRAAGRAGLFVALHAPCDGACRTC